MPTPKKTVKTPAAPAERVAVLDTLAASLDRRREARERALETANETYTALMQSDVQAAFNEAKSAAEQKLRDEQAVFETACEISGISPAEYRYEADEQAFIRLPQEDIDKTNVALQPQMPVVQPVPAETAEEN